MKKLLLAVLISIFAISMLAVPASASGSAGSVNIVVSTTATQVRPGQENVVFTLTLKNATGKPVAGLTFDVDPSPALTVTNYTIDCASAYGQSSYGENNSTRFNAVNANGTGPTTDFKVLTLTCKVTGNVTVGQTLTIDVKPVEVSAGAGVVFSAGHTPAAVTVYHGSDDHVWVEDTDNSTAATCTEAGKKAYKCSDPNCKETKVEKGEDALGHDWDASSNNAAFDWTGKLDGTALPSASIKVHCARDGCEFNGGDGKVLTGSVTETSKKKATCEKDGLVVYEASASIDGKTYKGTKNVTLSKTGHKFDDETLEVEWGEPGAQGKITAASAKIKCVNENCDLTDGIDEATASGSEIKADTKAASCEEDGYVGYSATFKFPKAGTKTGIKANEVIPATGHDWGEPDIQWAADNASVTATRTCKHDSEHVDTAEDVKITEVFDEEPACTEPGQHHYEAVGTYDVSGDEFKDSTKPTEVPATGHDYGENVPNVDWPVEFPQPWFDKTGSLPIPDGIKATLRCDNENKDIEGEIIEINETEIEEANYTDDGWVKVTLTAKFPTGKNDETVEKTATKTYPLPKLPLPTPSADVPEGNVGGNAKETLAASANSILEDVLKGGKPAGVPDAIVKAINEAAGSTEAGSMSISTELTVEPTTYPDAAAAYDISVIMTVKGENKDGDPVEVSDEITHLAQPIEIRLPKGSAGPIVKLVHIVDGKQQPVDSKVVGENVVFTAQDFSTYAILSSSDLADAQITGVEPSYTYTGSKIAPAVTVTINGGGTTLKEGDDYTVTYGDNTDVGAGTVTIEGIGNYTGKVELTFKIVKAASGGTTPTAAPTDNKSDVPATGDETHVVLTAAVLTLCAGALTVLLAVRRRREK